MLLSWAAVVLSSMMSLPSTFGMPSPPAPPHIPWKSGTPSGVLGGLYGGSFALIATHCFVIGSFGVFLGQNVCPKTVALKSATIAKAAATAHTVLIIPGSRLFIPLPIWEAARIGEVWDGARQCASPAHPSPTRTTRCDTRCSASRRAAGTP